jgi:hypothetical protein
MVYLKNMDVNLTRIAYKPKSRGRPPSLPVPKAPARRMPNANALGYPDKLNGAATAQAAASA